MKRAVATGQKGLCPPGESFCAQRNVQNILIFIQKLKRFYCEKIYVLKKSNHFSFSCKYCMHGSVLGPFPLKQSLSDVRPVNLG